MLATLLNGSPPQMLTLVYRYHEDDQAHSFVIEEIPGLVIMDWDLRRAYESALCGVDTLAAAIYGVAYEVLDDFDTFERTKILRCQLRVLH